MTWDVLAAGGALLVSLPPLIDGVGRLSRLLSPRAFRAGERVREPLRRPHRLLLLVPSRAEGARPVALCQDVARERERTPEVTARLVVVLDGEQPEAEKALRAAGAEVLVKSPAGPTKGAVLAWAAAELSRRGDDWITGSEFVVVLDADTRLPEGFLGALRVPPETEVFQCPVRPAGVPGSGAARVAALSLAIATRVEDPERDARSLPVRLRGKAMGLSPTAFEIAFLKEARTVAEDSEATIRLLAEGLLVRALRAPEALEDEEAGSAVLASSRARWVAGQAALVLHASGNLLGAAVVRPWATFVLWSDVFLRPRALVLALLAAAALVSAAALVAGPAAGGATVWAGLLAPVLALAVEAAYTRRARRLLGEVAEVPPVSPLDLASMALVWARALGAGLAAPRKWHRARPEA